MSSTTLLLASTQSCVSTVACLDRTGCWVQSSTHACQSAVGMDPPQPPLSALQSATCTSACRAACWPAPPPQPTTARPPSPCCPPTRLRPQVGPARSCRWLHWMLKPLPASPAPATSRFNGTMPEAQSNWACASPFLAGVAGSPDEFMLLLATPCVTRILLGGAPGMHGSAAHSAALQVSSRHHYHQKKVVQPAGKTSAHHPDRCLPSALFPQPTSTCTPPIGAAGRPSCPSSCGGATWKCCPMMSA